MKTMRFMAAFAIVAICFTGCSTQPKTRTRTTAIAPSQETTPGATQNLSIPGSPPPRVELVTAAPGVRYKWRESAWVYVNNNWIWVPGYWQQDQTSTVWTPGMWERTERGWLWVPGTWEPGAVGGMEESSTLLEMPVERPIDMPVDSPEALDVPSAEEDGGISVQVEPDLKIDLIQPVTKEEEQPQEEEEE